MTEHSEKVEQVKLRLEAEKWAKGVSYIHAHSLSSMHYDTRPEDTEGGRSVVDVEYNDGSVQRTLDTGEIVILGKRLTGQNLLDSYTRKS